MEKIIVFGMGDFYKLHENEVMSDFEIMAYLDNKVMEGDTCQYNGITVYSPYNINKLQQYKILLMSVSCKDMVLQLSKLGIPNERVIFGLNYYKLNENDILRVKNGSLVICNNSIKYISNLMDDLEINGIDDIETLSKIITRKLKPLSQNFNNQIAIEPLSNQFGFDRGMPIDRFYIEKFLEENRKFIYGNILEIGDAQYTNKFWNDKIEQSNVINVTEKEGCIKADLVTGEGLKENTIDCFILTQTLPFIYDIRSACANIIKVLKTGGVALITVPGIAPISRYDMNLWGHYWSFTDKSIFMLFNEYVDKEKIHIKTYGNAKIAMGYLYGASVEDMDINEFGYVDNNYQLLISAVIEK